MNQQRDIVMMLNLVSIAKCHVQAIQVKQKVQYEPKSDIY